MLPCCLGLRPLRLHGERCNAAAGPQPKLIPYSVTCTACDTPELVVEGVPTTGMTTKGVHVAGSNVNTITFSIKVGFADIALSELRTGAYRGQFSLLFEPHI
ncbi:hypothetical protein [Aeromonas salmonicida]|uniref:hypothetical protein n=1 Tax=Aeromonas salmonicida TaxID=645 RepID=UPI003CFC1888